jgi:hypothetical protein
MIIWDTSDRRRGMKVHLWRRKRSGGIWQIFDYTFFKTYHLGFWPFSVYVMKRKD